MAWPGKKPENAGRKKGTPNKTTVAVKAALLFAYDKIGGDEKFAEWALENPTEFYKLYAKMLPLEVDHGGSALDTLASMFKEVCEKKK